MIAVVLMVTGIGVIGSLLPPLLAFCLKRKQAQNPKCSTCSPGAARGEALHLARRGMEFGRWGEVSFSRRISDAVVGRTETQEALTRHAAQCKMAL